MLNVNRIIAIVSVSTDNGLGLEKGVVKLCSQQRLPELGEICVLVAKGIVRGLIRIWAGIYKNK